jgi:small subunit ribosomal protein S20
MAKLKTGRHTSSLKEVRKSQRRRIHNLQIKNKISQLKKQFTKLAKNKDIPALKELVKQFYKTVDKAAKVSFIHKNKAARLKSKLAKSLAKIVSN